jgi:hypothetical protein
MTQNNTTTLLIVIMLFLATSNAWPPVDADILFSVVHILDPTVEDLDALLTVIGYVDLRLEFKSFSLRIDGVAFCPAEMTGVIPII